MAQRDAIKYNRSKGSVVVSFEAQVNDKMRIGVKDTGYGIPDDMKGLIFQPFERFGNETVQGTGIGLTISKNLVEMMGGTIHFESMAGKGSFFYIDLAISKVPTEPLKVPKISEPVSTPLKRNEKRTILYVDDYLPNRSLVEAVIKGLSNTDLLSASNAIEGIELAQVKKTDLILMDIHLPGMDGLTAFKKLQESSKTKDIPVLALTADAMDRDKRKALEMGFYSYITKPINVPKFLDVIDKVLGL